MAPILMRQTLPVFTPCAAAASALALGAAYMRIPQASIDTFDYNDARGFAPFEREPHHLVLWYLCTALYGSLMVLSADLVLFACDVLAGVCDLPGKPEGEKQTVTLRSWAYVVFNQFVLIPAITSLVLTRVMTAPQLVWGGLQTATLANTVLWPMVNFALSDLVYYTGHRIVHSVSLLYRVIHKHHHVYGGSLPERGWVDTANAHPLDFCYTGLSTCPVSTLWLLPAGTVHPAGVVWQLVLNGFFGSLGHSRLNIGFSLPGIDIYRSQFHSGHHALSRCNYAQNIHLWDWAFGTLIWWPEQRSLKGSGGAEKTAGFAKKVKGT